MKILFFYPEIDSSGANFDLLGPRVPLGMAMVIAMIEKDNEILVVDEQVDDQDILYHVADFCPDLICISMPHVVQYNHSFENLVNSSSARECIIIVGGITYEWFAFYIMNKHLSIDFCVLKEGELKLKKLIESNFENVGNYHDIIYREGGVIKASSGNKSIFNMDELPLPAFDFFDLKKYGTQLLNPVKKTIIPFELSRGCINDCSFCDTNNTFGKFKCYSAEVAFEKLKKIKEKYNPGLVFLNDNNFLCDKEEIEILARKLIDSQLGLKFYAMVSINLLKKFSDLRLLYSAGFCYILIGLETADERFLNLTNKGFNHQNDFYTIARKMRRVGFYVHYTLIAGSREASPSQLMADYNLLKKLRPNFFTYSYYTPFKELLSGEMSLDMTLKKNFSELDTSDRIIDNHTVDTAQLRRDMTRYKLKLYFFIILYSFGRKHFMITMLNIVHNILMGIMLRLKECKCKKFC